MREENKNLTTWPETDLPSIPEWMLQEESYNPSKDSDHFVGKSMIKLLSLLAAIRENPAVKKNGPGAVSRLIFTLLCILLMAMSENMAFSYIILAVFLVRLVILPAEQLARVFNGAVGAMLLSMLILLPSVFMGSPRTMLTVSIKVFICVGLINLMSAVTPFNQITSALKVFHLPDTVIFIFDLTLKYIAILGGICLDMLTALKLRSVGRNRKKGGSMSGVLGVTFIKSREMADEMYAAMACRGFEGEYHRRQKRIFTACDIPLLLLSIAFTATYIYLEKVI